MLMVKRRKLEYFGHIMRNNKYRILQNIIQGKVVGRQEEEAFHGWLTCENGLAQHLLNCSNAQPIRSA